MKSLMMSIFLCAASAVFGTTPHVYVTDQGGAAVAIIDVDRNTVHTIFGFSHPHVVHIAFDGMTAYVGDDTDHILKINCMEHTVSSVGYISAHPVAIEMLPDASFLYTVNHDDSVSIIDLSNDTIAGQLYGFSSPQDIQTTLDGAFLYVTNKVNCIFRLIVL